MPSKSISCRGLTEFSPNSVHRLFPLPRSKKQFPNRIAHVLLDRRQSFTADGLLQVAFVFHNLAGDGYGVNPFANVTAAYPALAKTMSLAWVNFVTSLNPNGAKGLDLPHGANWPAYNIADGGGVGRNVVWDVNGSYVEWDAWRTEGINWMVKNSLAVFGI